MKAQYITDHAHYLIAAIPLNTVGDIFDLSYNVETQASRNRRNNVAVTFLYVRHTVDVTRTIEVTK